MDYPKMKRSTTLNGKPNNAGKLSCKPCTMRTNALGYTKMRMVNDHQESN
jgi:hypothetical protein